jgi:hypothetical protein
MMEPYTKQEIEAIRANEMGVVIGRLLATIELRDKRIKTLADSMVYIKELAAKWTPKGPSNPRKGMSWESAARIAMHKADDTLKEMGNWE